MFSLPHKIEIYGFWSNVGSSKSEPTMMTFYIDYIYNWYKCDILFTSFMHITDLKKPCT